MSQEVSNIPQKQKSAFHTNKICSLQKAYARNQSLVWKICNPNNAAINTIYREGIVSLVNYWDGRLKCLIKHPREETSWNTQNLSFKEPDKWSIAEVKIRNKIFNLVLYLFYTTTASVALRHVGQNSLLLHLPSPCTAVVLIQGQLPLRSWQQNTVI